MEPLKLGWDAFIFFKSVSRIYNCFFALP
jgi:hypothetical protein